MVFVLSLDGITKGTYESIRVGADFDQVMANLDRFQAYSEEGTTSLAHCLMTTNWWEFADLLRFGEKRGLGVYVNVVNWPQQASLYRLKPSQLREVVEGLERLDTPPLRRSPRLRPVWDAELDALRRRLAVLEDNPRVESLVGHQFHIAQKERSPEEWRGLVERWATGTTWTVRCDLDDQVQAIEPTPHDVLGLDLTDLVGRPLAELEARAQLALGAPGQRHAETEGEAVDTRTVFDRPGGPIEVRAVIVPTFDGDGDKDGKVLHIAQRPGAPAVASH